VHELEEVEQAWEAAQAGQGHVLLLAGEPGIGKTALAVQVAERAWQQGAVVLFGRCDEESVVAFQPWVESLATYVGNTRPATLRRQLGSQAADLALLLPELAQALPELEGVAGTGADTERYRIVAAVTTLVSAIADEAPLLLILDDLHWADAPTLQLLRQVIRATRHTAVLVLGAYRDTDLVRTHPLSEMLVELRRDELVHRLPMRGLSEDDVRALLGGPDAADELVKALWHETEGSPLFLREILRHLMETGALALDDGGALRATKRIAQLGIPEGVRDVIGRRLTRLSDAANVALRSGAVLGRELRLDVLERVTDLSADQLLDVFEEATAAGIVDEQPGSVGRWSFTHALVRQGLYEELSLTRRVRTHQQVAEALEAIDGSADGPHLAQLAFHFTQAAVAGGAEKAIAYSRRAGEYATSLAAHEEAARHYAKAVEVAEDVGEPNEVRIDLLFAQAAAEWQASGDDKPPQATLERAFVLLDPDDHDRLAQLAILYSGRAHRWIRLANSNRGRELLELALTTLPESDSHLRARTLAALSQTLYFADDPDDRSKWASDESVAMARRIGDRRLLAEVSTGRGIPLFGFGRDGVQEMIDDIREALAIAVELGDDEIRLEALGMLCLGLTVFNDLPGARAIYDDWSALAETLHEPNARLLVACVWAGMACAEGRFDDAERLFLQAFAIGQETRNAAAFIFMGPGMGSVRLLQGRVIEMIGTTSEYIDFFPTSHTMMYGILSLAYAECGMLEEARQFLHAADFVDPAAFPRRAHALYGLHPPARAAFLLDDADAARPIYEMSLPLAGLISGFGPANYGAFEYGLGLAAAAMREWDAADRHFAAAHAIHDGNGWRAIATECRWFHAAMLERAARSGDAERAMDLGREVVAVGEELGMHGRVRDAKDLLARMTGEQVPADTPVRARAVVRLRDRAKAKLAMRGRAAVAGWSRAKTDEELARRFEGSVAQRGLFGGMARAFQPAMAFGFEGDLVFELRPLVDDGAPDASDWWTIEVRASKATARRGRSATPTATIHAPISEFVRIASGEIPATLALLEGSVTVDGDVIAVSRLPDLFGMIEPLDGAELPAT
jgi:tetratricopeptide (TPR) repeat protein